LLQLVSHESTLRLAGKVKLADKVHELYVAGTAACELAPNHIKKLPLNQIKERMAIFSQGHHCGQQARLAEVDCPHSDGLSGKGAG
jgi:hypothetical protein